MPSKPIVLAVIDVSLTTIPDEPSKLPIVLPVRSPIWNEPAVAPTDIPMKGEVLPDPVALEVWVMPEMVFPWMPVAITVLVLGALIPLT